MYPLSSIEIRYVSEQSICCDIP